MYQDSKGDLLRRLRKIEGQVKGIQKMIENDAHCVDVLVQVAAVRSAINSVGKILLK
ncbi:MAG: CsoR family transcriptional regulator, copper-sensing transcriptional repressor, partial [Thermoanaerobacter sp.]|nr:CsoR family transcriptional regulator, copper-sensing transcriptional repressor [Thermoanaerobacter sp.]